MNKINLLLLLLLVTYFTGISQKKNNVLLTIDTEPVYSSEFKHVFNKNLDLVIEESQKNVDGYLDLFIDYKLKIAEAYAQNLDKNELYIKEFGKYEDQLSKKYIIDKRIASQLIDEAYERGKEEINADHILVLVNFNDPPKDTLIAYNKIKIAYDKAVSGEDFETLVVNYSEEPGAKKSKGKLGYFTVFQMLYPFETAAYNTKVGGVSKITRTAFGYHIIKINDRRVKKPKINVSHIMVFSNKDKKVENPEDRINELYAMIMQGESFENVAKQFSEDKSTGKIGGQIKTFGPGDLRAPQFEKAAYSIKNDGAILAPIKSSFGWHIIRLNEKFTLPSFEEQKPEIEKNINSGARENFLLHAINNKIISKYGYEEGLSYSPYFNTYLTDSIFKRNWEYTPVAYNETLFTIGDKKVKYDEFAIYIRDRQLLLKRYSDKNALLLDMYNNFKNETIKNYYKERLEIENEDYAMIINEYRNGLLVYDVMKNNIWQVAKLDSIGLKQYYEDTKGNYMWKERVDTDIISSTNEVSAKKAQELLNEGMEMTKIKELLNIDGKVNVIITSGIYEVDQNELPEGIEIKEGVSEIYKRDNSSVVVNVKEVIPPSIKEFVNVRGIVLSNYQSEIENRWIKSLRDKYKVEINKKSLKRIKKELDH
ncbi:MAG: peptidylprolyl isomerase [Flavobacteriales bacterium]